MVSCRRVACESHSEKCILLLSCRELAVSSACRKVAVNEGWRGTDHQGRRHKQPNLLSCQQRWPWPAWRWPLLWCPLAPSALPLLAQWVGDLSQRFLEDLPHCICIERIFRTTLCPSSSFPIPMQGTNSAFKIVIWRERNIKSMEIFFRGNEVQSYSLHMTGEVQSQCIQSASKSLHAFGRNVSKDSPDDLHGRVTIPLSLQKGKVQIPTEHLKSTASRCQPWLRDAWNQSCLCLRPKKIKSQ